jgi:hypothetical protein
MQRATFWLWCAPYLSLWLLICELVQVLFLSLVVNFSMAIFCLLPLDYICSQMHILTNYCCCGVHWLRIAQSKGYTRLCASSSEHRNRPSFENVVLLLHSRWWTESSRNIVSVNWIHALVSLLDFLTFEDGADKLFWNVVTLCNIP